MPFLFLTHATVRAELEASRKKQQEQAESVRAASCRHEMSSALGRTVAEKLHNLSQIGKNIAHDVEEDDVRHLVVKFCEQVESYARDLAQVAETKTRTHTFLSDDILVRSQRDTSLFPRESLSARFHQSMQKSLRQKGSDLYKLLISKTVKEDLMHGVHILISLVNQTMGEIK
jgi:hypothetical protein